MDRRDFLKKTVSAAFLGAMAKFTGNLHAAPAVQGGKNTSDGTPDIVAVRGGSPEEMFKRAMAELGGMEKFVQKGQVVTIKPNIAWDKAPEMAATTNPGLVAAIVKACFEAGASKVQVFDTTCNAWSASYKNSGIQEAAQKAGAIVVGGDTARDRNYLAEYYREVPVPRGKTLKKADVHKFVLDCDVLINVPILKVHGGAVMTCCMKNLMGIVSKSYHQYFHKKGLNQCIADCCSIRPPDLNIVDAYRVMHKRGPRGVDASDVKQLGYLLAGRDMVALDTASAAMLDLKQRRIGHIAAGAALGLGTNKLKELNIKRISM